VTSHAASHGTFSAVTVTAVTQQSRPSDAHAQNTSHAASHGSHGAGSHAPSPLCKGGEQP